MAPNAPQDLGPKSLTLFGWKQWPRWRKLAALVLIGGSCVSAACLGLLMGYMEDSPVVPGPDNLTPSLATKIYDINGQLITQLAVENRTLVHLDQVPKNLVNAIIALEDRRFMSHWGVDPWGILRAAAVNLKAGRTVEGGSTLTQQLAKNLFLTRERTFGRKIKEALLSLQIERHFTKKEILTMYFNQVYFGNGAYGVEPHAARHLFRQAHASGAEPVRMRHPGGHPALAQQEQPHRRPQAGHLPARHGPEQHAGDGLHRPRPSDDAAVAENPSPCSKPIRAVVAGLLRGPGAL